MRAAELKALGAVGADAAGLHHGKAPDQVIVVVDQVAVALIIAHLRHSIVPVPVRTGRQGAVHAAHFSRGGPFFARTVQAVVIKGRFVEHRFGIVIRLLIGPDPVRSGIIDSRRLVLPLDSGTGHLDQCLDQIRHPVVVCVVVCLHIHAEAQDVAVFIAVVGIPGVGILTHRKQRTVLDAEAAVTGQGFFRPGRHGAGRQHNNCQQS